MNSTGYQSQTRKIAAASPPDQGHARKAMTMQSPQYLRADQCAQQTLIRLVGSYQPKPAAREVKTVR